MHLKPGIRAPDFAVSDLYGNPVALRNLQGKKLLLSFYRYAGCPFCNLRVHRLTGLAPDWQARGLSMLAIFQSPAESILEHAGAEPRPFPIIPDPKRELYQRYGVEGSWLGMAKAALRVGEMAEALKAGIRPGKLEGDINMIPADFIIDESGKILVAYYGKDIGDHLPIEEISKFLA